MKKNPTPHQLRGPLPTPAAYSKLVRELLTPAEHSLFKKLNTPGKVQDFLDRLAINFDDTHRSPRYVLKEKSAQCIEGALFAAAALAYHGRPPLLMDFQTIPEDEDHVIALFEEHGFWGAISKTNHSILRFRDAVYRDPRELAMTYFHEYFMHDGRKSMRAYSEPFDLRRFAPEEWVTAEGDLWWLDEAIDRSKHRSPLPPHLGFTRLRRVAKIETQGLSLVEWRKKSRKKKK